MQRRLLQLSQGQSTSQKALPSRGSWSGSSRLLLLSSLGCLLHRRLHRLALHLLWRSARHFLLAGRPAQHLSSSLLLNPPRQLAEWACSSLQTAHLLSGGLTSSLPGWPLALCQARSNAECLARPLHRALTVACQRRPSHCLFALASSSRLYPSQTPSASTTGLQPSSLPGPPLCGQECLGRSHRPSHACSSLRGRSARRLARRRGVGRPWQAPLMVLPCVA